MLCCCDSRDSETIQHTLFECKAFVEDHNEPLKRLYVIHPAARGLSAMEIHVYAERRRYGYRIGSCL